MFDINPQGKIVDPNSQWIKNMEQNSFCHWLVYDLPNNENYRALYNGLTYWVKIFKQLEDGTLMYLFDMVTQPEEDEETGEYYLPNVSENAIREFLGWYKDNPIEYR